MKKSDHSRYSGVARGLRTNGVPTRNQASHIAFITCRTFQSAKCVLEFLSLSYSQLGIEYSRLIGGRQLPRQAVYKMLNAKRINDDMLQVLGQLISNRLTRICGETIGISIMHNSPMIITAYRHCDDCGKMYALDRPDVKRCKKCRARRRA